MSWAKFPSPHASPTVPLSHSGTPPSQLVSSLLKGESVSSDLIHTGPTHSHTSCWAEPLPSVEECLFCQGLNKHNFFNHIGKLISERNPPQIYNLPPKITLFKIFNRQVNIRSYLQYTLNTFILNLLDIKIHLHLYVYAYNMFSLHIIGNSEQGSSGSGCQQDRSQAVIYF